MGLFERTVEKALKVALVTPPSGRWWRRNRFVTI